MNDLGLFFQTGWHHIVGWDALDHILFIIALTALYLLKNWKQVLILVTAFTIGHSLTLALSVYDLVRVNERLVEFLIPLTIAATAIFNFVVKDLSTNSVRLNYFFALFFGLIHGLGFANTIRFMLSSDQHIGMPLLSFNLGLEIGQIIIVTGILLVSFVVVTLLRVNQTWWIRCLSGIALLMSIKMMAERLT